MNRKVFLINLVCFILFLANPSYAQKAIKDNKATSFINAAEGQIDLPLSPKNNDTDFIINAYNQGLGIDIQTLAKANMTAGIQLKPSKIKTKNRQSPLNLQKFFEANGAALPVPIDYRDYVPGDIIVFKIKSKPHFAIVSSEFNGWRTQNLVIHNNGKTVVKEDIMRNYPIIARYRFGL